MKLLRHLLYLIELLLRNFPALQEFLHLLLGVSLEVGLELLELLHHALELPHGAGHLPTTQGLEQGVSHNWVHRPFLLGYFVV